MKIDELRKEIEFIKNASRKDLLEKGYSFEWADSDNLLQIWKDAEIERIKGQIEFEEMKNDDCFYEFF